MKPARGITRTVPLAPTDLSQTGELRLPANPATAFEEAGRGVASFG